MVITIARKRDMSHCLLCYKRQLTIENEKGKIVVGNSVLPCTMWSIDGINTTSNIDIHKIW